MSRHRHVPRTAKLSESEDECDGASTDGDYGVSPDTAQMFIISPSGTDKRSIPSFIPTPRTPAGITYIRAEEFEDMPQPLQDYKIQTANNYAVKTTVKSDTPQYSRKITAKQTAKSLSRNSPPAQGNGHRESPLQDGDSSQMKPKQTDRTKILEEYYKQQELKKEKLTVNMVVIGHVDAGKSTLMGHLLCQMGQVTKKQLSKFKWEAQKQGKSSFAYAWILDQTTEERSRGVTIDVCHTTFESRNRKIIVLDAPGHKDFIPNMITGATQADVALLVVNASKGEFETGFGESTYNQIGPSGTIRSATSTGQTREHAVLARTLGISQFIVVVNKMDTVDWSQERYELICSELTKFFRKVINVTNFKFCPVSGLHGLNITYGLTEVGETEEVTTESTKASIKAAWYKGPCLLELIDNMSIPTRPVDYPARFCVDDVFKPTNSTGVSVSGRLEAGAICNTAFNTDNSRLVCIPSKQEVTVKTITKMVSSMKDSCSADSEESVPYAFAGDYVSLQLSGPDKLSLVRGDILCDIYSPIPITDHFKSQLILTEVPSPIITGFQMVLYIQCHAVEACIVKLLHFKGRDGNKVYERKKPRSVASLGHLTANIRLAQPIGVERFEDVNQLGKFVIRKNGKTLGGGSIIEILK